MRQRKPPPASPFPVTSHQPPQLRCGILVWIAAIVTGLAIAAIIIMAAIIDKQGSPLNGVVPVQSYAAVIVLLLILKIVPK